MKDESKTKKQLIEELRIIRQRLEESEKGAFPDRKRAAEALRGSEERFRLAYSTSPDAININRMSDGLYVDVNEGFTRLTGFTREDVIGKTSLEINIWCNPADRQELVDGLKERGQYDNLEAEFRRKDGSVTTALMSAKIIVLQDIPHILSITRDISDRKRAEDAIRENEAIFSSFLEHSPVYVFFKDKDMRALRLSKNYEHLLGMPIHQAIGKTMDELFPSDLAKRMIADDLKILTDGKRVDVVEEFNGRIYETTKYPILKDGIPIMLAGFTIDITERKRAEEALKSSREQYRLLTENIKDVVWIMDVDTMYFRYVSPSVERLRGYTPEEILAEPVTQALTAEAGAYVLNITRSLSEAILSGKEPPGKYYTNEVEQPCKDGSTVWTEVITSYYINPENDRVEVHGVTRDITERKQMDAERRSLEERMQRSEKMEALGMLAGGVAHDLNNVLGILVGYTELLAEDIDQKSPLRPHVDYIKQGGERAAAIVQDLLTMARRGVQTREIVDLNALVEEFRHSPEFEKIRSFHPNVHVEMLPEQNLLHLKGSSVHLHKTLMNLVSNAAEAMPSGGRMVIATANRYLDRPVPGYDHIQEGDYVVLSVSDTGEGISEKDLKKIFEPFYTKKVMGRSGTGLGLAVVWGTVKDHNGYVNVQSEEGKGSTFSLYFPVTREEISREDKGVPVSAYLGNGESILVIDDVAGQRDLAVQMLTKLNYKVVSVASGEEAVEYLKNNRADLLVLDMIMDPGIDGLDTYREILKLHPKQKAIIVSGFSESDRVRQAQALGAGAYVRKPYASERIGNAVRKELDRSA